MMMLPPSLQVGVQVPVKGLNGVAVAARSRVMTPARAVPPANPAATNVAAKIPVKGMRRLIRQVQPGEQMAASVALRNVENIVSPNDGLFCRDGVRGGILGGDLRFCKQPKAVYAGASGVNRTASQGRVTG
jgi:hypothetical protein